MAKRSRGQKIIKGLQEALKESRSPRKTLDLTSADNGNPLGLASFLDFVERELRHVLIGLKQPPAIQRRLVVVLDEIKGHAQFVHGYSAAEYDRLNAHEDGSSSLSGRKPTTAA